MPHTQHYSSVIFTLQAEARKVLDAIIPSDAHIILLDYPNYSNVGDSLIWLGEIAYLKSRNLKVNYVCDTENYNKNNISKILNKNSIILMNGGGNFGTLWEKVHHFRLKVLKDFPDIKIIQLPQTAYFDEEEKIKEIANAIRQQGNYTFLARSKKTYDFANKHFDVELHICPDMAFFIGEISPEFNPKYDRFILSRADLERLSDALCDKTQFNQNLNYEIADWMEASQYERFLHRLEMHSGWLRKIVDPNNLLLLHLWNHLSRVRMRRGIKLLSSGRVVMTDRLHAHILSILIGKPHVIADNSYGKVSDFYQTWTFRNAESILVSDLSRLHTEADNLDSRLSSKRNER
jgi:pyruvyl transferase EpsO